MGYKLEVSFFNSFLLKQTVQAADGNGIDPPVSAEERWPGLPWNPTGYPTFPFGGPLDTGNPQGTFGPLNRQWYVEESRVRGGFDNVGVDIGVRAFIVEDRTTQLDRSNSLIYSGVLNSRTGINQTNVFSVAESITRTLDPNQGSIQKLHAEDTNLVVFQENKVSRALIDKDTIYTAEGGTQTQTAVQVIGQIVPYLGEYGISTDPGSFAYYGYGKYFTDRTQGLVMRLSRDGLTEISRYGMRDYFRDYLATISDNWTSQYLGTGVYAGTTAGTTKNLTITITAACCDIVPGSALEIEIGGLLTPIFDITTGERVYVETVVDNLDGTCTFTMSPSDTRKWNWPSPTLGLNNVRFYKFIKGTVIGGWDIHSNHYILSLQKGPAGYTPAYDYTTVSFDEAINGWTSFHSYQPTFAGSLRSKFFTFNGGEVWEHYDETTVNNRGSYYGGVKADSSITFIFNPQVNTVKNFQTINYEGSNGWEVDYFTSDIEQPNPRGASWIDNEDDTDRIYSYIEGQYDNAGAVYPAALTQPIFRAGFDRKENRFVANLVQKATQNNPLLANYYPAREGEVIFGSAMSGIKGYYSTVKISTDASTQVGGSKELFSVASAYVMSST